MQSDAHVPPLDRLRSLPKAEVHAHLEGCFEPAVLEQWAAWHGRLPAMIDAIDAGFAEAEQDGLPPRRLVRQPGGRVRVVPPRGRWVGRSSRLCWEVRWRDNSGA